MWATDVKACNPGFKNINLYIDKVAYRVVTESKSLGLLPGRHVCVFPILKS